VAVLQVDIETPRVCGFGDVSMDQIEEFVDERHKGWCVHCATGIHQVESNRDHVPSKSFLRKPYPENLPTVDVCKSCNEGFSVDEEYFAAFMGCVLSGSTDPDRQHDPRVRRILTRSPMLRQRIEDARTESRTLFNDEPRIVWSPERERIERIVLKNARGHACYEYGEPMLEPPDCVWLAPLASLTPEERSQFEDVQRDVWPEVGSRMLTRVVTGQDLCDGWVVAQDGVYRYAAIPEGRLTVRSVIHEYLATEARWD
jgi:hypothetical protein